MRFLHALRGIAHFVYAVALAGPLGGVGKQRHTGIDPEDLCRAGSFHRALHHFVLTGINIDGAVAHRQAFLAAHQNKAGTHRLDAGFALDQLQRRTDGIRRGIGSATQQAIRLAHFHKHRTEVVGLGQCGTALLFGHLALTQFHHLGNHLIKALIRSRVNDLCTRDVKAPVGGRFSDSFRLPQQDHAQRFARQQTAGRRQNTCVGAFRKNDGLGFSPQLFFKLFKNGHKDNYLHIFGAESLCIALTASL